MRKSMWKMYKHQVIYGNFGRKRRAKVMIFNSWNFHAQVCANIQCIIIFQVCIRVFMCVFDRHIKQTETQWESKMKKWMAAAAVKDAGRKREKIDHGIREDKKTQSAHKQPNALHYFSKNINLSYWYRRRVKHDVTVWARESQNGERKIME